MPKSLDFQESSRNGPLVFQVWRVSAWPRVLRITIRRADVPGWSYSSCGVVYLDERRVALLIGGRPRTIVPQAG